MKKRLSQSELSLKVDTLAGRRLSSNCNNVNRFAEAFPLVVEPTQALWD